MSERWRRTSSHSWQKNERRHRARRRETRERKRAKKERRIKEQEKGYNGSRLLLARRVTEIRLLPAGLFYFYCFFYMFCYILAMQDINFDTIIPILESNDVEFAGVFGSFAKGKASEKSDIDLLVKFTKPKSLMKIIRLERMLSEKLDKKIDLVTDKALSPYIKEIILNDLRLIYGAR